MKLGDISSIKVGSSSVLKVMLGGAQVWPVSYVPALTVRWSDTLSMPARGGSVTATWTLTVTRNGVQVYQNTVTPTSVSWSSGSDPNLTFDRTTGVWTAPNRGTNGYAGGGTRPTQEQLRQEARSASFTATWTGSVTIDGQVVSGLSATSSVQSMTQSRNYGAVIGTTYSNLNISFSGRGTQANPAYAYQQQITVSAKADSSTTYEWSSQQTANYTQSQINAQCLWAKDADWCSLSAISGTSTTVTMNSRGKKTGAQRSVKITGTISSLSKDIYLYQEANSEIPIPATYSSVYVYSVKIGSSTVLISNNPYINDCKEFTVTDVVVKANYTTAGKKWTSYADGDGDTSAIEPGTTYTNQTVEPTANLVVGGAISTTKTSFTVKNQYTTSEKAWTVTPIFYSAPQTSGTVTQKADSKTTGLTKDRVVNYVTLGSGDIWAGGGTIPVTAQSQYTQYDKWNSDNTTVSGSEQVKYAQTTLSTDSLSSTGVFWLSGTSYDSSTGVTSATLNHRDMTSNETTDEGRVKGTYMSSTEYSNIVSVSNSPGSTPYYGSWHQGSSTYNGNYRITSFSADAYTSALSAATFKDTTTSYSVEAAHTVYRHDTRDVYYYYSSNWASQHGGSDHNDSQHRVTNADADSREYVVNQTAVGDNVNFSYDTGNNWLTASNGTITIAAQPENGEARDGHIYATNAGGGSPANVRIYQKPYASISVSPSGILAAAAGENIDVVITYRYTRWSITYRPTIYEPSASFEPSTGGNANGSGSETVTVKVAARGHFADRIGRATIKPGNSELDDIYLDIAQSSS